MAEQIFVYLITKLSHLEKETIPHAAISDSANHFFIVQTLRKSEIDLACCIEGFQLPSGKHEIQTGEIVLELRYLPRSDDRDYWNGSIAQPREGDLRHTATGLFGDRLQSRDDPCCVSLLGKELLHLLSRHPPAVGFAFAVIFSAQNPTSQRRPGQYPYVQGFRHGNKLALDGSFNKAVLDLQCDELGPASELRQSICLGDPTKRERRRCRHRESCLGERDRPDRA